MLLALLACRPEGGLPPAPDGPLLALDWSEGAALFDAPFPSSHRMKDGAARVDDWPNPDEVPYVETLLSIASSASGFGTTSGILFRREDPETELKAISVRESLSPDSPAMILALDGPQAGQRFPFDLWDTRDGGPFGAPGLVTLLPLQGAPLPPETTVAAVLLRDLAAGEPLGVPQPLWALAHGQEPGGLSGEVLEDYTRAVDRLDDLGVDREQIAGLTVFRTWDPAAEMRQATAHARTSAPLTLLAPLEMTEVFDSYCLFESTLEAPVYQSGVPPFSTSGGGWEFGPDGAPVLQRRETSRIWLTLPRQPSATGGYPVTVMSRTGGGGDRPMVDRGVHTSAGETAPGSGPASHFAAAGHVGVQIDGPHGGPYRNPSGADEQFLMFNVSNPLATRDNVRQSALELALLPDLLAQIDLDPTSCPGAGPFALDLDRIALLGHSMGATIAPLTLAAAPEYGGLLLSGAGGSYLYNLVYKRSPLDVRPIAEALLGFTARGRTLREDDPVLQLLQWASEPADPPPYARLSAETGLEVLMVQGIVDTYILPPMANATSLSYGLSLAGTALDDSEMGPGGELEGMRPLSEVLPYGSGRTVSLPYTPEGVPLRAVLQVAEDGYEDGHEVFFQTELAQQQYRCFLSSFGEGAARLPAVGATCP